MAILKNTEVKGTLEVYESLDVQGTDYIKVASGTTAERPASPSRGMLRFNTSFDYVEYYDGIVWQVIDPTYVSDRIAALEVRMDTVEAAIVTLNAIKVTIDSDGSLKTVRVTDTTSTPSELGAGTIRYNSTLSRHEYSDGTDWLPMGESINWSTITTYVKDDVVWDTSSLTFYYALQETTGDAPLSSPLYWKAVASAPGSTWNIEAEYSTADIVWYTPNELWYSSKVDGNVGNAPGLGDATDLFWQVEGGLSGVIQDFDGQIAHVDTVASESIATGWIELTASQQLVLRTAYPKYSALVPSPQWGGDVLNAGIPSYSDLGLSAPETGASHVIYVGNGSLSLVEDTSLDNRVTALENTLAVVEPPYDTGWLSLNMTFGATIQHTHGFLGALDSELDYSLLINLASDGSSTTLIPIETSFDRTSSSEVDFGYSFSSTPTERSEGKFSLRIGSEGIKYISSGRADTVNASWYYKVVVTKKALAPLMQANYFPFKDWVEVWSGDGDNIINSWGEGKYRVTGKNKASLEIAAIILDTRDGDTEQIANQSSGRLANQYDIGYSRGNGWFHINGTGAYVASSVIRIERWEDTLGGNASSKKLSDGYETVWEDFSYASNSKELPVEDGTYIILGQTDSGSSGHTAEIRVESGNLPSTVNFYGSIDTDFRAYYTPSIGVWNTGSTGIYLKSIRKQTGMMSISVNHTNRTISGVPQTFMFKKDTTAGDVTMTADVAWSKTDDPALNTYPDIESPFVIDGDYLIFHNSGTVAAGYSIKGMPDDKWILPREITTYIADKDNHEWVQEVPRMVRAEYENTTATLASTPAIWTDKVEDTHNAYDNTTGIFTAPIDGVLHVYPVVRSDSTTTEMSVTISNETTGRTKRIGSFDFPSAGFRALGMASSIRVSKGDDVVIKADFDISSHATGLYSCVWEISGN